jgi:hypothetical protein
MCNGVRQRLFVCQHGCTQRLKVRQPLVQAGIGVLKCLAALHLEAGVQLGGIGHGVSHCGVIRVASVPVAPAARHLAQKFNGQGLGAHPESAAPNLAAKSVQVVGLALYGQFKRCNALHTPAHMITRTQRTHAGRRTGHDEVASLQRHRFR